MDHVEEVFGKLMKEDLDEVVVEQSDDQVRQIRFSESAKDLFNTWNESAISVLASKGKRVVSVAIKDYGKIDEKISEIAKLCRMVPENPEFMGINPKTYSVDARKVSPMDSEKISEYTQGMIDGARDSGSRRSAGVVYRRYSRTHLKTPYNDQEYETGGTELVIRSFIGESTGQENYHFGPDLTEPGIDPHEIGGNSARIASESGSMKKGEAGKFTVLMSPYVIGNILTYSGEFLSSHMIRTGLSFFVDKLDEEVASNAVTLSDDPTNRNGEGARPVDDEGTPTRRNTLIERGKLKTYLHSYSTATLDNTETTGNAGILSPYPFQLSLEKGKEKFEDMLAGIQDGLFINNVWYSRFQDYRNGIFSTVPRDGVFRIKDGRITESWSGIRISDSVPDILGNITKVSEETKNAKWWLEIGPSIMPYVLVEDVNITKSF